MKTKTTAAEPVKADVMTPTAAAERMGVSVPVLVALLRKYHYPFTELVAGGRPGDVGARRWGLTEAQYLTILGGQQRAFEPPKPEAPTGPAPKANPVSPDGRSRLRKGRASRAKS